MTVDGDTAAEVDFETVRLVPAPEPFAWGVVIYGPGEEERAVFLDHARALAQAVQRGGEVIPLGPIAHPVKG